MLKRPYRQITAANHPRSARQRRRASIYILVLGCALIVTVIGLSAVTSVRLRQRSLSGGRDFATARWGAQSAVDLGMQMIEDDPDWRTNLGDGLWIDGLSLGEGTLSLRATDPDDGDLADNSGASLELTGIGRCDSAQYNLEVTLVSPLLPLPLLACAAHAGRDFGIDWTVPVQADGAPLSANVDLVNWGYVDGDVEADYVYTYFSIDGDITTNAPPRDLPASTVFDQYVDLATAMPNPWTISRVVIGPGYNPYGSGNAEGIYFIDTGGNDLWIEGARIEGTLVIDTHGATVHVSRDVLAQPARPEFPVLIVDGHLSLGLRSYSQLDEDDWGTNYNPPAVPYEGQSDTKLNDSYPSELRGLVHATGTISIQRETLVHGLLIAHRDINCYDELHIHYDPDLYENPPLGYTMFGPPEVVPGSWRQVILPAPKETEGASKTAITAGSGK